MDVLRIISRAVDKNGIDPDHLNITTTDPVLIGMQKDYCTLGKCPMEWAEMDYRPTIAGSVIYAGCLAVLLAGQLFYGIRKKTWTYMAVVSLGIVGEIVGYIGRIMLNRNPFLMDNFLMNLVPLTIAPALLTAGIYLCLGRVITAVGPKNSRLKPKLYSWIFVGCDLFSLILQGAGGGIAATADDQKGSDMGVNLMIAGLIFQVVSMTAFFIFWCDFIMRTRRAKRSGMLAASQPPLYHRLRATKTFKYFQWSIFIASVLIYIRCVYRVAELWNGFDGHLANDEATFMIFEGPMIILALLCMTVYHPGRVFDELWVPAGKGAQDHDAAMVKLTEPHEWDPRDTAYERMRE